MLQLKDMHQDEKLHNLRHSLAHVLAQAILQKFPEAKLTIGPVVENGFYYDIDFGNNKFTENDFATTEADMRALIAQKLPITGKPVSADEAIRTFQGNPYKLELIEEIAAKGEQITLYYTGEEFFDLCRGGHTENIGEIDPEAFKLDKVAGAYWKGDAKNKQLTRIYGLAFNNKEELDKFIWQREEAEKRDHRKLGRQLKIYTISDLVGSGLPLFQKNGQTIRRELTEYLWELHKSRGYDWVWTPHLAKEALYQTSGHAGQYMEDMFSVWGGTSQEKFYVKPMNCPHHMQLFADNQFSYKDMPVRYFEPATVYRDEKTGQLSGLTRVRALTQDDGHIYCRVNQIEEEVETMVDIIESFYKTFGMNNDYRVRLSLRDEDASKWLGEDANWEIAQTALTNVCKKRNLPYTEGPGEAAFYGPKLDFIFKDAIGRDWQLSTIQCDFVQPNRFKLSFVNEEGKNEQPVVIHRAISGSLERFIGVAIENFAGAFPVWLHPTQVTVLPISDKHISFAGDLEKTLKAAGVRVELDARNESLGKKIRAAKEMKVPYIIVLGDKEIESQKLTIETRTGKLENVSASEFVDKVVSEIKSRSL
jgi:threonyl-tRNA synthetase